MEVYHWIDILKKLLIFGFSIFLICIGFKISLFYIPFLIAFVLAQLIEPLIRFCMRKFKMRRKISAILIFRDNFVNNYWNNCVGNNNTHFRSYEFFK